MDVDCSEFENLETSTPRTTDNEKKILGALEILDSLRRQREEGQDDIGIKYLPYDELT